jgi:cbb3-type cytochrome oxidase maturation protein
MAIAPLLIILSLIISFIAVGVLIWSLRSGQYDDLEGEANRILFDDNEN